MAPSLGRSFGRGFQAAVRSWPGIGVYAGCWLIALCVGFVLLGASAALYTGFALQGASIQYYDDAKGNASSA